MLEALLDGAGGNVIPAPALAPDEPCFREAFTALKAAGEHFDVAPGRSLADYLWTHGSALYSGEMAAGLRADACQGRVTQGFLALYATRISSPLVYCPGISPLRVRDGVGTLPGIDGPFLVLVACEAGIDGRPDPLAAFAMPIYHARRLMPVASNFDRDVLRVLERLQAALDAFGAECTIRRVPPAVSPAPTRLIVSTLVPGRTPAKFSLAIDASNPAGSDMTAAGWDDFLVTPRNLANGGFVSWLERMMMA